MELNTIAKYPPFDDSTKIGPVGPPGIGFDLTEDGNYDMNNKIIKNCGYPEEDKDVSTKKFLMDELDMHYQNLLEKIDFNKNYVDEGFDNFVKITGEQVLKLQTDLIQEMKVRNANKVIFVSISGVHNLGHLIFNTVKSDYFEDNLKLKFDMTMVLTLFFEVANNNNNRIEVIFETINEIIKFDAMDTRYSYTDSKKCIIFHTLMSIIDDSNFYNCSVVLNGKIGDIINVHIRNLKNPFLKIEII